VKKIVIVSLGIILLILVGFYIYKTFQSKPFLIKGGSCAMTLQFISDPPGIVNIITSNDSLLIKGSSISSDSSGYIQINVHIEENVPGSFKLVG